MAQLEGKLLDVEDSPDAHPKLTPDYQLDIGNGLEPPEEEEGLATPAPTPTYVSKNTENDGTKHLKQLKFVVQDPGYEEEGYIVVDDVDSGINYDNAAIVQDEVLKVFSGLDTFGTRDIFKGELKDFKAPKLAGTDSTASRSNLSGRDDGSDCARVNGVIQFFDSIHALSIVAQDLEDETSLQSTFVHVGPAKNIEKQENRCTGTGLVYSHPSIEPDELITTMEPPKNDEHKADNVNSETALPGSSRPISDESTEKDDENVQLRDNAQEPDYASQQDSSDIAQGQKEDFTRQPATDADDFVPPVPEKGIMQMPPKVEQKIETHIEEDPVFSTIRENFYDAEAPDNMQRSFVSQEAEYRGQDELGISDSAEAEYRRQGESQRSDSDEVRSGPRPDNLVIPEETIKPVEEKPNTVEGRGDEGAEIASKEQEELEEESEDEEKQKSYDHQKSYTKKIYETASSAAQAVALKLGYGAAEGQSEETDGVNEGNGKGAKGIVDRAGEVVASFLGRKHQEKDGQQQEQEQEPEPEPEPAETENVEIDEPQFWDAEAENVETAEGQTR